jgi:hypothetical protein
MLAVLGGLADVDSGRFSTKILRFSDWVALDVAAGDPDQIRNEITRAVARLIAASSALPNSVAFVSSK